MTTTTMTIYDDALRNLKAIERICANAMLDNMENDRLHEENARLRAAVERVRALHPHADWSFCPHCRVVSPCPTLRALDGEAAEQEVERG